MRELKRSVARGRMEMAGLHRLTKGGTFRRYWRWALQASNKKLARASIDARRAAEKRRAAK